MEVYYYQRKISLYNLRETLLRLQIGRKDSVKATTANEANVFFR